MSVSEHGVLDIHVDRYARRALMSRESENAALFAARGRADIVSLSGGMPDLGALKKSSLAEHTARVIRMGGQISLQYGSPQGMPKLREQICDVMALEGIVAKPGDIVITPGSQLGLDLVTRLFCDPGDVVLVEAPSYVGALEVFAACEAQVEHVEIDASGLRPEALVAALSALSAAGRRAKFLYTVPNFQNPAGVTLDLARRDAVVSICRDHGVLIVEDNPYGLLGLDGRTYPALRSLDAENVVYLGSFSKILAPGLRVGWVLAPPVVRERLVRSASAVTLCPPTLNQAIVSHYLAAEDWKAQIEDYRDVYRRRRDTMLAALAGHMPRGCGWSHPQGGFFVWLTLPEGMDSRALVAHATNRGVTFVPGTAFYGNGNGSAHARVAYSYADPERMTTGIRRLAAAMQDLQKEQV
jgi:2-aminoadipate transaminase